MAPKRKSVRLESDISLGEAESAEKSVDGKGNPVLKAQLDQIVSQMTSLQSSMDMVIDTNRITHAMLETTQKCINMAGMDSKSVYTQLEAVQAGMRRTFEEQMKELREKITGLEAKQEQRWVDVGKKCADLNDHCALDMVGMEERINV